MLAVARKNSMGLGFPRFLENPVPVKQRTVAQLEHDQADNPLSAVTPKDMATFCAAPPVDIPLDLWPVLHEPHVEPRIDDGYVPVAFVPRGRDGPVIRVVPHDGIWIYVRPVLSQSWGRRQTDGSFVNLGHGCEQTMHMIRHKSSFYSIILDDQNSANVDWPFFRAVELALNSPKSSQIQVETTPTYSIQLETLPFASSTAYFGSIAYPERTVLVKRSGVVGTSSNYNTALPCSAFAPSPELLETSTGDSRLMRLLHGLASEFAAIDSMKPFVAYNVLLDKLQAEGSPSCTPNEFVAILHILVCVGRLPWVKVGLSLGRTLLSLTADAVTGSRSSYEVCVISVTSSGSLPLSLSVSRPR